MNKTLVVLAVAGAAAAGGYMFRNEIKDAARKVQQDLEVKIAEFSLLVPDKTDTGYVETENF
jgi:hypothetical protein